ncbi:hypothetical protein ACFQ1M_14755 [Sungkyunkwania multivorans]|uniref:Uncharacterized protein n=1 Tax=Sungkyunkwania multivorans TaxID=1173618 RepID=A0ABW3D068_9FLAO
MKLRVKIIGLSAITALGVALSSENLNETDESRSLFSSVSLYDNYAVSTPNSNVVTPTINTAFIVDELMARQTRMIDMHKAYFDNQEIDEAELYMRTLDNF